jgi:long-chain fatty acid transport protein
MKKTLLSFSTLLLPLGLMAGGIVTNTNQSAMFTRMQARDATLEIDAAYYNPAGLTLLPNDGFFISLNNQTVWQTRTITTDYTWTNEKEYIGKIFAPVFPSIYAAYKKGNFAFSLGFNPIGGGGGGTYDKGLPSFDYIVADLVPGLQANGLPVNGYNAEIYFEGSIAYFGYQANIAYKINDMISVAIGGRYVTAKEAYNGYLRNVQIDSAGKWMRADNFFTVSAAKAAAGATKTAGAATNLNNAIAAGYLQANDPLTDPTAIATLTALGHYTSGMTNIQAAQTFQGISTNLTATAAQSQERALLLHDQEAEYEKTATGFTPIISVNIKPAENLNIALKYEGSTKLEFENNTTKDFVTDYDVDLVTPLKSQFPDGAKARYDIPAQLTAGVTYRPIEKLFISAGFHYYFDQQANWEGREDSLKGNMTEYALGLEYTMSNKLKASVGWLHVNTGAEGRYQTDLSYSMNSNTFGGGFAYQVTPYLEANLACSYSIYETGEKSFNHDMGGSGYLLPLKETYDKDVFIIAIGLNFNLAKLAK